MNLADLMDEAAEVLEQISGLRVKAHPPDSINGPAGVISYPESIDYDQTYGGRTVGTDKITGLTMLLLVNNATARTARDQVARWTAGTGVASVKQLMESHDWQSCDDFFVKTATFDVVTVGGIDYLAAIFTADAMGEA